MKLLLAAAVLAALSTGCASGGASSPPPTSSGPRARCLANPGETGMRPLIFLFCVESP